MLLSEFWEIYEIDKRLEGYSEETLKSYNLQNKLFIKYYGDYDINNIKYKDIKEYLAKDAKRLKPSSISFRMKYFRSIFRYAIDEGLIMKNPATKLRDPKMPKRVPKDLDEEQIELLRMSCTTTFENALLEVFFSTGCRVGEIHKLNRDQIDFMERTIVVIGKGDKERVVFFDVRCAIWLKKYLKERTDNQTALFVTCRKYKSNGGEPRRLTKDGMRWTLNRIAKRADIKNVYPHKLRHSFAMHMLTNGAPLEAIQSFLGHAKLETTRIYADYNTSIKKQLYSKYY